MLRSTYVSVGLAIIGLLILTGLAQGGEQGFTVSGTFEARTVRVMSEVPGRVERVLVEEGMTVEAGQPVVVLDAGTLPAQIAEARAALDAARAQLAELEARPHPGQVQVARAQVGQARAQVIAAEQEAALARAMLASPTDLDNQIRLLSAQLNVLEEQLDQARARRKQALVTYEYYKTILTEEGRMRAAAAEKHLAAAEANVKAVKAEIAGTRRLLHLLETIREEPLALLARVHQAEGQVRIAQAQLAVAERDLALAQAPPREEELAYARAGVAQAQAALDVLLARQAQYTLTAPVTGTITARLVEPGEVVQPGQSLLEVGDLRTLDLIVYVPEPRLGQVFLGQDVRVKVDAFPGRVFTGTVVWIADEAEFTPKNVQTKEDRVQTVFRVKVRVPNPDGALKAGMPADATFVGR